MTQLTYSAEPLRRPKAQAPGGQLSRLMDRARAAGRGLDLIDLGVSLWIMLWASCVSASVFLLTSH